MTADALALTPTLEDYLEAVCWLVDEKGHAHVGDIAEALSVHKSTVSTALKSLADKELVAYTPYQATTLTPKGRKVVREIVNRHETIRHFLADVLCLPYSVADDNACRMEHVMGKDALKRLSFFIRFVRERSGAGQDWVEQFRAFFEKDGQPQSEPVQPEEGSSPLRASGRKRSGKEDSNG
jgi:DtxR family Mn-dependent transcriptional regulator